MRLSWFWAIFGNGGLLYWFECDQAECGLATSDDLRAIGLHRSADALAAAYEVFPTLKHWQDWNLRMRSVRKNRKEIKRCEDALWSEFAQLEGAAGRFVRANRRAFRELSRKPPYDPKTKTYARELL